MVLGVTSIAPVAYFMYQNWLFSQWAKDQANNGGFVCGTGMFALLALCIVVAGVISAAATLLGSIGYLRIEKPRPRKRLVEIALLGSVLVIASAAFLAFI